jgi:glycosyltransferase involved in cell wall biosynthesis
MRIGYLVPEFPGQTHAFFWRELSAMEEQGAEIRIISTRRPPIEACPHAFRDTARERTYYVYPPNIKRSLGYLAKRPRRLRDAIAYLAGLSETPWPERGKLSILIASAADLAAYCAEEAISHVHIHSCANAAHLGALARLLGGPSYSLTLHGDLAVYGTDHAAKFQRAAFVSAVTRPLAETIRGVSPAGRTPVIWMGVDTEVFSPAAGRASNAHTPFTLATVARLNRTKGHVYALRAIASLIEEGLDIRYKIAGSGPEHGAIRELIDDLGLGDRVTLLGSLGEDGVRELLQEVDALALTSFGQGEAAPVTVMEAMSCGLPVICSSIGGTPDMIQDGYNGFLVPQQDIEEIASAIRRLAHDGRMGSEMGMRARETALAEFNFRRNAARLMEEISCATS